MEDTVFWEKGPALSLRFMEEKDFPLIVKWRNKDWVRKNFIYRKDFTMEGQRHWQETMIDTGKVVQFIICENKRADRPIGCVYFRDIDTNEKCAEYGIFIGEEDCIGKGYGSEAAMLASDYARDEMGVKKLILRVFCDNIPAIRSYEKAGYVKVEKLPLVTCSDGQKNDMILMEKIF